MGLGRVARALGALVLASCAGLSGLTGGSGDGGADGAPDGSTTQGTDATPAEGGGGVEGSAEAGAGDARLGADADAAPLGFAYRRRITILNTSTTATPMPSTVRVPLDATMFFSSLVGAGKLRADFADLRVIGDMAGERNRIVDPPAGLAPPGMSFEIVVPIAPNAKDTDFAIYYGDPNAASPPADGAAVFPLYDDFTNGVGTFWQTNGKPQANAGVLVLRAGQQDAIGSVAASDNVPPTSALEASMRVLDPQSAGQVVGTDTFWYWLGYQHKTDFVPSDPWIVWIARGAGTIQNEQESPGACASNCVGTTVQQTTAFRYYAIERDPVGTRFSLDGALTSLPNGANTDDYSVLVRNYALTTDVQVDWIRARARVSPDPAIQIGPEETLR